MGKLGQIVDENKKSYLISKYVIFLQAHAVTKAHQNVHNQILPMNHQMQCNVVTKKLFMEHSLKTFCLLTSTAKHIFRQKHEVELWEMEFHLVGN